MRNNTQSVVNQLEEVIVLLKRGQKIRAIGVITKVIYQLKEEV